MEIREELSRLLIESFVAAWNEVAHGLLDRPSKLTSLSLREVADEQANSALAVAATWSAAFAAECQGALGGVIILLFKTEDDAALDRLVKAEGDGGMRPGTRALADAAFAAAAQKFSDQRLDIGRTRYLDLTADESRLRTIVGNQLLVGTFSLAVEGELETQVLLLYAPRGALAVVEAEVKQGDHSTAPPDQKRTNGGARAAAARNIERLLDVELDVIVRFGATVMPLRDVVRMGVGTMIELNRTVDEPVEILVNGRPLARGEVVVVDGYYGVRITEIGTLADRALSMI